MRQQTYTPPIGQEYTGTFNRVRWSGNGTTIIELEDGRSAICPGTTPDFFHRGFKYLFMGQESDYKGGRQIKATSCQRLEAATPDAVLSYLTRVGGVTPGVAKKLFERFGEETLTKVKEGAATELPSGVAERLNAKAKHEKTLVELNSLFAGRGFNSSAPDACIQKWGANAPAFIRRNPFLLMTGGIPSAGVKRCDKLWLELGKPAEALKRQFFWLWQGIADDGNGDTWFEFRKLSAIVQEQFGSSKIDKVLTLGLRSRWLRCRVDREAENEKKWITSRDRSAAEHRIAGALERLHGCPSIWPQTIETAGEKVPTAHQLAGIRTATENAVGVLVGSPGTGKTFSVAFLIAQAKRENPGQTIYLVAPTGKAAVRLTESMQANGVDVPAQTIHRLLGAGRKVGGGFLHGADNPLPIQSGLILVDESSMIDAELMACLLEAIPTGCNVLFVGDTNQLAPVGHGAPLRDIIAAGITTGRLTEIRRNAGRIVQTCAQIRDGKPFQFSPAPEPANGENLLLYTSGGEEDSIHILKAILGVAKRYDPIRDVQVMVARNDSTKLSRKALNPILQGLLNPSGFRAAPDGPRVGDKVICTANCQATSMEVCGPDEYLTENWTPEKEPATEFQKEKNIKHYVANGEIGYVLAVGGKDIVVELDQDRTVQGKLPTGGGEDAARFELAYAVSGHKMQGSEAKLVIILADKNAAMVASREWWYTSISRARELCVVIGNEGIVRAQVKRQTTHLRKTFLKEIILEGPKETKEINQTKEEIKP